MTFKALLNMFDDQVCWQKRVNESLIIKLGAQMTLLIEKEKSYHSDFVF